MSPPRHLFTFVVVAAIASCAPTPHKALPAVLRAETVVSQPVARPVTAPAAPPQYGRTTVEGIRIDFVAFDSRKHRLEVADQPGGPGSRWADAAAAGRATGAIASINGGFFTPEGKPLGWVVDGGKQRGSWNFASSLGTGVYRADGGKPMLLRREKARALDVPDHLLQSGPFLIENGRSVPGLSRDPARDRSFVAWDGGHRWLIGRTSACSLAALGAALADAQPAGFPLRVALNLDGGSSSDLWVSETVRGGPASIRRLWNRPVRNYLVLRKRGS